MYLRDYEAEADITWKDCPFCGGRPTIDKPEFFVELGKNNPGGEIASVYCRNCDCELSEFASKHNGITYYEIMDILRAKWNGRASA